MSLKPLVLATLLACLSVGVANAQCNPTDAEQNILFCYNSCFSSGHQTECDASGDMAKYAASGDALGIRNRFGYCHSGRDDEKMRANVEECFLHAPKLLIQAACNVYKNCSAGTPIGPKIIKLEFNRLMQKSSSDKNVITAEFLLDGAGQFQSITLDYYRDDKDIFSLSTYGVTVTPQDGKSLVRITTYDKTVENVSDHHYYVAGTLELVASQ